MKQYKVIAGACPCPNQRMILNSGDVVSEDFFLKDEVEDFISRGFIAEVPEEVPAVEAYDKMTVKELEAVLSHKGIEFKPGSKKDVLLGLLNAE